jgi:hypothetical protein
VGSVFLSKARAAKIFDQFVFGGVIGKPACVARGYVKHFRPLIDQILLKQAFCFEKQETPSFAESITRTVRQRRYRVTLELMVGVDIHQATEMVRIVLRYKKILSLGIDLNDIRGTCDEKISVSYLFALSDDCLSRCTVKRFKLSFDFVGKTINYFLDVQNPPPEKKRSYFSS